MEIQTISPERLAASVISVPPLARTVSGGLSLLENRKILNHLRNAGVTTFLYGGNAIIYHLSSNEFQTLVEMLVATAVGAIVIAGAYASYILVANQYDKIKDVADMQGSGRGVMRIMERDIRMAGFTWRDNQAKVIYGSIAAPVTVADSGNSCCDSISVVYD